MFESQSHEEDEEEDFYTPGEPHLYDIRTVIANSSIKASNKRLHQQYKAWTNYNEVDVLTNRRSLYSSIKSNLTLQGSQIISQRFTSTVAFNGHSRLAVGSWDGDCHIIDPQNDFNSITKLNHGDKISNVEWAPINGDSIAVCGFNPIINVFNQNLGTSSQLKGHLNRITNVKYHPHHPFLFSSSHDETWRMWDLNTQSEIYYQEGHIGPLHSIDVHIDGSILSSCGNDGVIKLWDLRTGHLIADLVNKGHVGAIHSLKFRSNGFHIISGGVDHNVIVWDLRKTSKLADLPIHKGLITGIELMDNDMTLVTSSYDGNVIVSECDSWKQLKKFESIDKIMDISCHEHDIISVGWAGDVKLYSI